MRFLVMFAVVIATGSALVSNAQDSRLRSVRVSALDVVKTADFYEAVFGMHEVRRIDRNGAPFEVILNYGADQKAAEAATTPKLVVILRDAKAPPPSVSNLIFGVADVDRAVAAAVAAGGVNSRATTVSQTSGMKISFIKDPAGNEIELIQEKFE